MRQSIVAVLVVLLAACTGPADPSSSAPTVEPTPDSPPVVIPPEALPVPEPSPWPLKPDEKHDHPTSTDTAIGQERPFKLYIHCGVDFRVDFDGSFWQSYTDPKIQAMGDPFQKGTMTLVSGEVAVFRFESQGKDASIYFVRNDSPKPEAFCM